MSCAINPLGSSELYLARIHCSYIVCRMVVIPNSARGYKRLKKQKIRVKKPTGVRSKTLGILTLLQLLNCKSLISIVSKSIIVKVSSLQAVQKSPVHEKFFLLLMLASASSSVERGGDQIFSFLI